MNKQVSFLFDCLQKNKSRLFCSPTTFAITYYFINKQVRDKRFLNSKVIKLFSHFIFTREDVVIMEKVKKSSFADLEDALQYYSALDSGVHLIITKNFFDFKDAIIPVFHPLQYINQFLV